VIGGIFCFNFTGADLNTSIRAVNLSEKYDMIYAAVGVHPHDVKDMDSTVMSKSVLNPLLPTSNLKKKFSADRFQSPIYRQWKKV
jgi:Tat protein secretion system quality control protein TatD with DNase activity